MRSPIVSEAQIQNCRLCTSRSLLEDVSAKWGLLALVALQDATLRFGELRRRVDGVSEKMLSQTLQVLERDGLVVREVRSSIPPHVEYSLTPLGREVAGRALGLIGLLEDHVDDVVAARERYDARGARG